MYKKECKWCNTLIEVDKQPLFALHVANCKSNPSYEKKMLDLSIRYKDKIKVERISLKKTCPRCSIEFNVIATKSEIRNNRVRNYCSRKCSNFRIISDETKNKISKSLQGNIPSNKGKRKIYKTICLKCQKAIVSIEYRKNRKYHYDCWRLISGGIRKGSSRGKSGWYKGFWCDSSYELAFLIFNLERNIKIERNKEGFEYLHENEKHLFYPDFIVDGKYVEIKNFKSDLTNSKISYFPHEIKIYYKDTIKPYLNYVISKYGKNFTILYENK